MTKMMIIIMSKMIIMSKKRWKLGGSSSDGPDSGISEAAHTSGSSLQVSLKPLLLSFTVVTTTGILT